VSISARRRVESDAWTGTKPWSEAMNSAVNPGV
jgi:hypothetical protein